MGDPASRPRRDRPDRLRAGRKAKRKRKRKKERREAARASGILGFPTLQINLKELVHKTYL